MIEFCHWLSPASFHYGHLYLRSKIPTAHSLVCGAFPLAHQRQQFIHHKVIPTFTISTSIHTFSPRSIPLHSRYTSRERSFECSRTQAYRIDYRKLILIFEIYWFGSVCVSLPGKSIRSVKQRISGQKSETPERRGGQSFGTSAVIQNSRLVGSRWCIVALTPSETSVENGGKVFYINPGAIGYLSEKLMNGRIKGEKLAVNESGRANHTKWAIVILGSDRRMVSPTTHWSEKWAGAATRQVSFNSVEEETRSFRVSLRHSSICVSNCVISVWLCQ